MDKQQKNVYPNQPQSGNFSMLNHIPLQQLPQQHQQHPHSAAQPPHLYQQSLLAATIPQMQPVYYAASPPFHPHPAAQQPQQHFVMGPPPAYSNSYPTGYCSPPAYQPPIYHGMPGYSVPMSAAPTAIFDSSARFNGKGPVSIPPPPPGYLPNAAQVAAMQGQTVLVEKKKSNFFNGGKGGGYTFW